MSDFKKIMESLNIKKNEKWLEEAKWRRDNKWRLYSVKIAARVLTIIQNDEELNQTKLAETLNVSRQRVSEILNGKENLTLETIWKLSEALGVQLITFPPFEDLRPLEKGKAITKRPKK